MKITIEGDSKEIAKLVRELQKGKNDERAKSNPPNYCIVPPKDIEAIVGY